VNSLIQLLIAISLLKAKPQDLPTSAFLAGLLAVINLIGGALVLSGNVGSFSAAFQAQLVDVVLMAAILKTALQMAAKPERFFQAASALYGTGIFLTALSLPLLMITPETPLPGEAAQTGGIWSLFSLILIFWSVAIGAHIIKHTFEIPFALGIAFSVSYFILILNLVQPILQHQGAA